MRNISDDSWMRRSVKATSQLSPTPAFRHRVMTDIAKRSRRMRRVSTIVLWSGIALTGAAGFVFLTLLPFGTALHVSMNFSTAVATAGGFVLATMLGLATWEWIDRAV